MRFRHKKRSRFLLGDDSINVRAAKGAVPLATLPYDPRPEMGLYKRILEKAVDMQQILEARREALAFERARLKQEVISEEERQLNELMEYLLHGDHAPFWLHIPRFWVKARPSMSDPQAFTAALDKRHFKKLEKQAQYRPAFTAKFRNQLGQGFMEIELDWKRAWTWNEKGENVMPGRILSMTYIDGLREHQTREFPYEEAKGRNER